MLSLFLYSIKYHQIFEIKLHDWHQLIDTKIRLQIKMEFLNLPWKMSSIWRTKILCSKHLLQILRVRLKKPILKKNLEGVWVSIMSFFNSNFYFCIIWLIFFYMKNIYIYFFTFGNVIIFTLKTEKIFLFLSCVLPLSPTYHQ